MEDLAHFIESMSEKYGLLDADNKESRESLVRAGSKQIECRSAAVTNSCSNEAGQASNWEDLSIFVSGQTLGSKAIQGSGNLHAGSIPFQSKNDTPRHAYARMLDINKEPDPESPLPTTSHVVTQERERDDAYVESGSVPELGVGAPPGKDFSNVVTMSDYLQSVYCAKENSRDLWPTDDESLNGPCHLQPSTCKLGDTSKREDSSQTSHRGNDQFYSRDLDECHQSGVSSCRSHHIEDEPLNSVWIEDGQLQNGGESPVRTAGDAQRPYESWKSVEIQPKLEKTCTWKPTSIGSSAKSVARASEQEQTRSRRQRGIVSSFEGLEDAPEFGGNVGLHDYSISNGGSTSRSCRTEGGDTDIEGHEKGNDDRSRTRMKINLGVEYSNYQPPNISSDSNRDKQEPVVEDREQGAGPDSSCIDLVGERDSLSDPMRLPGKEQKIRLHCQNNLLSDIHQNDMIQDQERHRRGLLSSYPQGAREDYCDRLNEEGKIRNGAGYTTCRADPFEYCCGNSLDDEQQMQRQSISKDGSASHAGSQDTPETSARGEQQSKRGVPQQKRTKNGEEIYVLESANEYIDSQKSGDLLSSIQAPASSEIHYRSSLLDNATNKLIAETEASHFPSHSQQSLKDSFGNRISATLSTLEASSGNTTTLRNFPYVGEDVQPIFKSNTNSRLTKNRDLENSRPQTPGSLVLPRKDMVGSFTLDESRILESWELGEDFNLPSSNASWGSGSIKSKWMYINKILCDNGFSPLNNSCLSQPETFDKLFDTLNDVVRNYSRREKLVQELLAERDSLRQEEQRNDQLTLKLESDIETLKQKLASTEQRAELAAGASEKTLANLRREHQRLEATHANAIQRCSQLEHVCRAKERSLRKLQEKIQEAVRREQSQRSRDRELYEKLKHKVAISQKAQGEIIESNFLLRDLKPACIVGIYERQRAGAEAEMNQLREENSRLCKELRDKENSLLSKAMTAVEADQAELDQREQDLIEQLTEVLETQQIERKLGKKLSQYRQPEHKEDSALLPLAFNEKDDMTEENVNYHKPMKPVSAENNSSILLLQRLQLDASQERRNNQLLDEISKKKLEYNTTSSTCQTSFVGGCTNGTGQEFLQDVCSKLKLADPLRITDAVDSLLKVVTAVPRMESFIDNICEVVFNEGCMFLTRDNSECVQHTPEAIPDILKIWLQRLQSTEELLLFKDSVCTQLWERYDDKAEKHPMNCKLAAASVKDLINIERQYLLSQQSYREAQTLLKAEPQKLLHRIIGHFQMLFEIPRLEGVMAVMNSVYIQISEYHNFARALCSMLGLPKDSGANTIISAVTGILNKA